jgi:hypothetical protein
MSENQDNPIQIDAGRSVQWVISSLAPVLIIISTISGVVATSMLLNDIQSLAPPSYRTRRIGYLILVVGAELGFALGWMMIGIARLVRTSFRRRLKAHCPTP